MLKQVSNPFGIFLVSFLSTDSLNIFGISVDYKKSFRFDDEAEIRVFVTKYNGAVLELGYEFVNVDSGEICTKASSRHGFIKDGKLVSLKKALPELDQKIREYVGKEK